MKRFVFRAAVSVGVLAVSASVAMAQTAPASDIQQLFDAVDTTALKAAVLAIGVVAVSVAVVMKGISKAKQGVSKI